MIVWILIDLYHKNLKDFKTLCRFIKFEEKYEFLKIYSKFQKLVKKKWWGFDKRKLNQYIF